MKKYFIIPLVIILFILMINDPLMAGAGGSIAKAISKNFWVKLLMVIVTIIFLPLILYIYITELIATRKTKKDLAVLSQKHRMFQWIGVNQRIKDVFMRVQRGWDKGNVSEVSEWMDDWYWQNQQYVFLDKWENEGLKNVTSVLKINSIKPLYVNFSGEPDAIGSLLVVSIDAKMQDYLVRIADNIVVEGDKEYKDVEKVWTFVYKNNGWVVQNIEDSSMSRIYQKEPNVIFSLGEKLSFNEKR